MTRHMSVGDAVSDRAWIAQESAEGARHSRRGSPVVGSSVESVGNIYKPPKLFRPTSRVVRGHRDESTEGGSVAR